MSKKASKSPAAEVETAQPETVDAPEALEEAAPVEAAAEQAPELEEAVVPAPGEADRTNGAFGEAPVAPVAPPAASRPTAADLVAKVLGGQGAEPSADAPAAPADTGVIQLSHGGAHDVGDAAKNPPALTAAELDALAPRLRLPGGAPVKRASLSSASRHTKGLLVVLSNRTFVAKGVRV